MLPDEVEHEAGRLVVVLAQAAAELLEEQCRTVRGAQEQQGVDSRKVHTLVEQIYREEDGDLATAQALECGPALLFRAIAPDRHRRHAARWKTRAMKRA